MLKEIFLNYKKQAIKLAIRMVYYQYYGYSFYSLYNNKGGTII